jgi:hypothetical protein
MIPEIDHPDVDEAPLPRPSDHRFRERTLDHRGKQRHDVDPHRAS